MRSTLATIVVFMATGIVQAGMVTYTVDQLGPAAKTMWDDPIRAERYLFLSLGGLLLSAWIVQAIWNALRGSFPKLPRLSYARALAVVGMWGVLFVLVLLMISGAREFLTPGAWERQGSRYRLRVRPEVTEEAVLNWRRHHLDQLRMALWTYAESHNGQFPPSREDLRTNTHNWQVPDGSGLLYHYVPGEAPGRGARPLVYEPDILGPSRLVLLTNGDIRVLHASDLEPKPSGGVE
jgi:hypothetical protein